MLFGILPAYQSSFALINVNITGNTAPPYFKGGLPLTLQVKQCQNLTYTLPQIFDPDRDAFEAPVVQLDSSNFMSYHSGTFLFSPTLQVNPGTSQIRITLTDLNKHPLSQTLKIKVQVLANPSCAPKISLPPSTPP